MGDVAPELQRKAERLGIFSLIPLRIWDLLYMFHAFRFPAHFHYRFV
jgi:hypothetical protein